MFVVSSTLVGLQYADASLCVSPHCYAQVSQSDVPASYQGIKYQLHVPDMFIKSDDCLTNVAVATQWIILPKNEWIELGVTQGGLQDSDGDGTGDVCISDERVYYGFNYYYMMEMTTQYSEYTISHDFDVGDTLNFEIRRGTQDHNWLLYLHEYSSLPIASFDMFGDKGNDIQSGLEGTLRSDQYSSIGVAKFADSEKLQDGEWSDNRLDNTRISTSQGYKLTKCGSHNTFVAGIVTELDCDDLPSQNTAPVAVDKTVQVQDQPVTIPLEVAQPNRQHIEFNLISFPTYGTLDHNNRAQEIPNQGPESSQLVYTPVSLTDTDSITYSVSDGEFSDNGVITLQYSSGIDSTPPTITAPDDITVEASDTLTQVSLGTATADDNQDLSPTITNDAPASFPLGTITVTWTATDASGNSATDSQIITVQDTTPPVFDSTPDDVSVMTESGSLAVDYAIPAATDLTDDDVDVSCIPAPNSVFPVGTTTVTCTATDDHDNSASVGFDVVVSVQPAAPDAPLDLRAESVAFDSVNLRWSPSESATSYDVLRKLVGTPDLAVIDTVSAPSYVDGNVNSDTEYVYRVVASNDFGDSPRSAFIRVMTLPASATTIPDAPQNLKAVSSHNSVTLSWDAPDGDVSGYQILKRAVPAQAALSVYVENTQNTDTTFVDVNVLADAIYVYRVKAINSAGLSDQSNFVRVATEPTPSFEAITDDYSDVDSWTLHRTASSDYDTSNNRYVLGLDSNDGNPAPSGLISGDGFVATAGMKQTVDLRNLDEDDSLFIGVDYKATSNFASSSVTNAMLQIFDSHGSSIYTTWLNRGGTFNTGWQSFSANVTDAVSGHDDVSVWLGLTDSWIADWRQKAYFDNFYLGTTPPASDESQGSARHAMTSIQELSLAVANANADQVCRMLDDADAVQHEQINSMISAYNTTVSCP